MGICYNKIAGSKCVYPDCLCELDNPVKLKSNPMNGLMRQKADTVNSRLDDGYRLKRDVTYDSHPYKGGFTYSVELYFEDTVIESVTYVCKNLNGIDDIPASFEDMVSSFLDKIKKKYGKIGNSAEKD